MVAGCSNNIMKYILLFFNLIIFLLGLGGLIVGIVIAVDKNLFLKGLDAINAAATIDGLSDSTLKAAAYVLIGVAAVIMLISFLGCCGAWKEVKCLLGTYAAVMFVLFILMCAVFILFAVKKPTFEKGIRAGFEEAFKESKNNTELANAINKLFNESACCGIDAPKDIQPYKPYLRCPAKVTIGCYTKVKNAIDKNIPASIGIAVAIALVQLFLIIFSCCLCRVNEGQLS